MKRLQVLVDLGRRRGSAGESMLDAPPQRGAEIVGGEIPTIRPRPAGF
jgi:hypothetical protein